MDKIIKFKTISSTNDYIKEHYVQLEDGTIVLSEEQTKGRGRSDHQWISQPGNLYMSRLKKTNLNQDSFFAELIQVSMSVVSLLHNHGIVATIKYPNDILVSGQKICGILIEGKWSQSIEYLISGIGINVNQLEFHELNKKATSINKLLGVKQDLKKLFDEFWTIYRNCDFNYESYIENSMIIGKQITHENQKYNVVGIDKQGFLLLENNETKLKVRINEISLEEIYHEINN